VELPSPFEGVVTDLLAAEGATVDVGTPILSVNTGAVGGEPAPAQAGAKAAGAAPAGAAVPGEAAEVTAPRPAAEEAAASGEPRTGAAALPAADAVPGTQDSAAGEGRQAVLV